MDDGPEDRTARERAARQIDARAARFGAGLVSLLTAGFLGYGGFLLVRGSSSSRPGRCSSPSSARSPCSSSAT